MNAGFLWGILRPIDNPRVLLDTFFKDPRQINSRNLQAIVPTNPQLEDSLPSIAVQSFKQCLVILTQAFPEQDFSNITNILNLRQFISRTREIASPHDAYGKYGLQQVDRPTGGLSFFARSLSAIQEAEKFLDLTTASLQVLGILAPDDLDTSLLTTASTPPQNPVMSAPIPPRIPAPTQPLQTTNAVMTPRSSYAREIWGKAAGLLKRKKTPTPKQNTVGLGTDVKDPSRRRILKMLALGAAGLLVSKDHPKSPSPILSGENPKTGTSKEPTSPIEEFLKPFITEAMEKRAQRSRNDPEYSHRVDEELNSNRINVLIWGYSEEHGSTYEEYDGAPSILSYDLKTGKIGVVHLSRDIRVPEITQIKPDAAIKDQRIRTIFKYGGFPFLQKTAESITGLAIDYQIVMKDIVLRDVIQQIAGGKLNIDVNKDHATGPFRLDRVQYGDAFIHKGLQEMDTALLMRYILAEDKNPGGKEDERSYRKNTVLNALSNQFKEQIKTNPAVFLYFLNLLRQEIDSANVKTDFDLSLLSRGTQVAKGVVSALLTYLGGKQFTESKIPYIDHGEEIVFHDPYFGDGGVRRVHSIRDNTEVAMLYPQSIVAETHGKLPDWMLIPEGGDPYSNDLVTNYWSSIRTMIKGKLQPAN